MSKLNEHARMEFKAAGWLDDTGAYLDEMQGAICEHVLELLTVFSNEGHSGTTAPYTVDIFKKLAMFEPLVPLTGEDWEWVDVSDMAGSGKWYQNKRCGHVFKDDTGVYDSEGIIFYDWCKNEETGEKYKSYFTSRESRVPVTFPYTPKTEYKEWIEE